MPYLVFDSGDGERIQIPITKGGVRIGRDPASELVIPNEAASRHHATIKLDGALTSFRDEQSHNGSLVNGARTTDTILQDGDEIRIGGFKITFLERDPYGEDSVEIKAPAAANAGRRAGKQASPPPLAAAADANAAPRGNGAIIALLVLLGVLAAGIAAAGLLVIWPRISAAVKATPTDSRGPSATAGPVEPLASATPAIGIGPAAAWQDGTGFVSVASIPPGFEESTRTEIAIRYLGPPGGRFQSAISVTAAPARPGATAAAEMSLAERALQAELGTSYERIGGGEISLGGRGALFLIYHRPTKEGVMLKSWIVLAVEQETRVSFSLTSEVGQFEGLKQPFAAFLKQVRYLPAPGEPTAPRPAPTGAP